MTESAVDPQKQQDRSRDVYASLQAANQAGRWMAWAGLGLAVLWWGGAIALLLSLIGPQVLADQTAMVIAGVVALIVLPGGLMIMAGFMARQSRRANEANILMLKAAGELLSPARKASADMATLADATRQSTMTINRTMSQALSALKGMTEALAEERLRAESVGYAMADNARELTRRLGEERASLETLTKGLDDQTRTLNEAIPRQADAMVEAAKAASAEVARADEALEARLKDLKQAGSTLAVRLIDLDTVARDAAKRTEALDTSVTQIGDKLARSHKTIEMAEQASAMAVEAATSAGDALKDAVSAALDGARDANREISETTQQIRESSARAISELQNAGEVAISTIGLALEGSQAIDPPETLIKTTVEPAAEPAPAQADSLIFDEGTEPDQPRHANGTNGNGTHHTLAGLILRDRTPREPAAETGAADNELFEADTESPEIAPEPATTTPETNHQPLELGAESSPILLNRHVNGDTKPAKNPDTARQEPPPARHIARPQSSEWRDIIADMGNEAAAGADPTTPPEGDAAEELIHRLERSGITLPTAIRSRDKKKIAAAARKDEDTRRTATRDTVGGEVSRVAKRLKQDTQLTELARHFVVTEKSEALRALAATSGNGRHASPRLSAYLLVDAALTDNTAGL